MRNLLTKADSYLPNEPTICLEQLQQCSSIITNSDNDENKGIYYLIEGKAYINFGKIPDAKKSIEQGLSFSNLSKVTYARLVMYQGYIAAQNHEIALAKAHLKESIKTFKALNEFAYLADALAFKGMTLIKESNFTEALAILMDSLDLAISHQRSFTETRIYSYLSLIHYWLKDLDKAQ
ncbi:MAG: tetratricopeptide (TPR) repeat protein [Maribacter sp.]|jgi:tetratricopeptide (TPR) repeat protein